MKQRPDRSTNESNQRSNKRGYIYMAIAAVVWIGISAYLIHRYYITGTPLNLRTLFPVIASGIIIFVPLYKKYFKEK